MEHVISLIKNLFKDIMNSLDSSSNLLLYIGLGVLLLLLIVIRLARKRRPGKKSQKDGDSGFIEVGPEPVIVYNSGKTPEKSLPQTQVVSAKDKKTAKSSIEPVIVYSKNKKKRKPKPEHELEPVPFTPPKPEPLPKFTPSSPPEPECIPPLEPVIELAPTSELESDSEFAQATESEPKFDFSPKNQPEPSLEHTAAAQPQHKPEFAFAPEPQPVSSLNPEPLDLSPHFTSHENSPFQQFMDAEPGQEAATAFRPAFNQEPLPLLESDMASEILLMFSKQGFHIEKVVYHGTYGADFIISAKGMRAYVQVKDWKKKATPRTVQEARYYSNTNGCHTTILIPATGFTSAAKKEAVQRAVLLWDMKTIKKLQSGQISLEEMIAASSF